jgi:hypothetical protein
MCLVASPGAGGATDYLSADDADSASIASQKEGGAGLPSEECFFDPDWDGRQAKLRRTPIRALALARHENNRGLIEQRAPAWRSKPSTYDG